MSEPTRRVRRRPTIADPFAVKPGTVRRKRRVRTGATTPENDASQTSQDTPRRTRRSTTSRTQTRATRLGAATKSQDEATTSSQAKATKATTAEQADTASRRSAKSSQSDSAAQRSAKSSQEDGKTAKQDSDSTVEQKSSSSPVRSRRTPSGRGSSARTRRTSRTPKELNAGKKPLELTEGQQEEGVTTTIERKRSSSSDDQSDSRGSRRSSSRSRKGSDDSQDDSRSSSRSRKGSDDSQDDSRSSSRSRIGSDDSQDDSRSSSDSRKDSDETKKKKAGKKSGKAAKQDSKQDSKQASKQSNKKDNKQAGSQDDPQAGGKQDSSSQDQSDADSTEATSRRRARTKTVLTDEAPTASRRTGRSERTTRTSRSRRSKRNPRSSENRRGRGRRSKRQEQPTQDTTFGDIPIQDGPKSVFVPAKRTGRSSRRARMSGQAPAATQHAVAVSPPKTMLVRSTKQMTQIVVLEKRKLVEHYVTDHSEKSLVGNIYKGRVQNVLPGMEAAFIDIGQGRNGVLYAGEVIYDDADIDGKTLPRIETMLQPGQTLLVQVTKDAMGTKGVRLTQQLSLAGRYCVLAPYDQMLGISRKLPDQERERLRKILKSIRPTQYGLIVRTAAEGATREQLTGDVERLLKRWETIEVNAKKAKALESVYLEPDLVLRVIRDAFGPEHEKLFCDDEELATRIRDYLQETIPEYAEKVSVYQGVGTGSSKDMFNDYDIQSQILRALETKVWLPSGGYLIIEKTEAMWVIDVNTGKFVGKDNLEETILRNNIEAAEEIAKQLRLRDMGGIIVIDFVDMLVAANRNEVIKRFKTELAMDKTRTRVTEISKLGLVQMTRKNVAKGLIEMYTELTDDVIPGRRIKENLLK